MMKKLLAIVLTIAMMLSMSIAVSANEVEVPTVDTWDGTADISWYNAEETEFTLTTAEALAGFGKLVDEGNTFEGKTVKLGADIDLELEDDETNELVSFDPIGYGYDVVFKGTFDGQGHTIKNLYQNGWALGYSYSTEGGGLFASVVDATIKNLTIDGAEVVMECIDMGIVVGYSYGNCTYENITVTNSSVANYQRYTGGVVGEVNGTQLFKNVNVTNTVTVASMWGDFDASLGGIVGGKWGDADITFENCNVACCIDAQSDVVSSYQWYAYRRCGMLIGHTEDTDKKDASYNDNSTYAGADFVTVKNCEVTIGEWANYTYCEFAGTNWPWVRVQAGLHNDAYSNARYGHPTDKNGNTVTDDNHEHNEGEGHFVLIEFKQLFGGGQGVYGPDVEDLDELGFFDGEKNKKEDLVVENKAKEARQIASVEDGEEVVVYESLQDAINAVEGEGTVVVLRDTKETIEIGTKPEEDTATLLMAGTEEITGTGVVLDLGGNTLTGNIIVYGDASATIKNGKVVNENGGVSAIQTFGTTVLEELDVTSARHAVRVEGGLTTIKSGIYKVAPVEKMTLHAVNVSDGGEVVIDDGTFTGPAGTAADSGSAVNIQAGSTGTINGGTFTGGFNSTLSADGKLTVTEGMFDQDPTPFLAKGLVALNVGEMFGVAAKTSAGANEVIVEFERVNEDNTLYNINIVATDDIINRLTSADLTFALSSDTDMAYEIVKYGDVNYKLNSKDRYLFNFDGVSAPSETGKSITIGQVKFGGYGEFTFKVATADTNIVNATTIADSIVSSFVPNGDAVNTGKLNLEDSSITATIEVPTHTLTVNYDFINGNAVQSRGSDYMNMTITVSGGDITEENQADFVKKIGDGYFGFSFKLTENIAYDVTVTGDGYRTARYTVTMTNDKVLTFWNNVKDEPQVIEKDADEATGVRTNFLAGDIVADNKINIYDLSAVVSYFGKTGLTAADKDFIKYDLNRDGKINSVDVSFVLVSWGN